MHNTTVKKTDNKIVIRITKVATGHQPHTTGSGAHHDKRTKRCRTRATKHRAALRDWN